MLSQQMISKIAFYAGWMSAISSFGFMYYLSINRPRMVDAVNGYEIKSKLALGYSYISTYDAVIICTLLAISLLLISIYLYLKSKER